MTPDQLKLAETIREICMTEDQGLDTLQDSGLISDHCVRIWDVCDEDARRAAKFLVDGIIYRNPLTIEPA